MINLNQNKPPRWPLRFLRFIIKKDYLEEIEGDMAEVFQEDLAQFGIKKARKLYTLGVFKLLRPNIIKSGRLHFIASNKNPYFMYRNYLKSALRNLLKHPTYTSINLLGLSCGIGCCLLMLALLRHEISFDRFHSKADRIYRVVLQQQRDAELINTVSSPLPMADALENDFPQIEKVIRLGQGWSGVIKKGDIQHHESELFFTDPEFFDIFDITFLDGNRETALLNPQGIVITESIAQKYFSEENPIGQVLEFTFEGQQTFEVTGVVEALPDQSHFNFDFLLPISSQPRFLEMMGNEWKYNFIPTYFMLRENTHPEAVAAGLSDFVNRNFPEPLKDKTSLSLQSLTDIHLYSNHQGEIGTNSSMGTVWFFGGIALLLLLVASINFMNLATARSVDRAKEVGVRKAIGASRNQLMHQFLGEALILSSFATILGLALAVFISPWFNELTGSPVSLKITSWDTVLAFLGLATLTGLVAGSYPAFFLSNFHPAKVLKGKMISLRKPQRLRHLLVVIQFTASAVFLIAVLTIQQQLNYILDKPLGFDKEEIVFLRSPQRTERMNFETWREALLTIPGVEEATGTSAIPGAGHQFASLLINKEGRSKESNIDIMVNFAEHDFAETFGLQTVVGRDFSSEFPTDPTEALVINESAVKSLDLGENPVGERLSIYSPNQEEPVFQGRVVGVLKDFHFEPLYQAVRPLAITSMPVFNRTWIALRLQTQNLSETLSKIEDVWKQQAPEWPLQLSFLDQKTASFYANEHRTKNAVGYASLLVILMACFGIFGLSIYTIEQRRKEIGIRKVLGASVSSIFGLLTRHFMKWVLISLIIASPLAWWIMERWLDHFAYRIALHWWIIAIAATSALLITLLTIGLQSIKAALANPVDSLRSE